MQEDPDNTRPRDLFDEIRERLGAERTQQVTQVVRLVQAAAADPSGMAATVTASTVQQLGAPTVPERWQPAVSTGAGAIVGMGVDKLVDVVRARWRA